MNKIILLAPLALVVGCSQSEPAPEPTEEATTEVAGGLAIDGKPNVGSYEVTSADGATIVTQTVNADGTFTSVEGDKTTTGTWTSTGPGNWCVTYEGETEATCYGETISDEGIYTSTNVADPKDSWTVKRTS